MAENQVRCEKRERVRSEVRDAADEPIRRRAFEGQHPSRNDQRALVTIGHVFADGVTLGGGVCQFPPSP